MAKKSDLQKLQGILEEFDQDTVLQAIATSTTEPPIEMNASDCEPLGKEIKVGNDAHVKFEDLPDLERLINDSNLLPVHFLEEGAVVQRAVARVYVQGRGYATGFLVSSSLLMTNNHVLPDKNAAKKAKIQFNYQENYQGNAQTVDTYSVNPDKFFYTNPALDVTLVRINSKCTYRPYFQVNQPLVLNGGEDMMVMEYSQETDVPIPGIDPPNIPIPPNWYPNPNIRWPRFYRTCKTPGSVWGWIQLPNSIAYAKGQHLNIIQHPRARRKEVAVQDNELDNIYTTRVRYTTDTERGSSGSPVFNNGWEVIALHHAGGKRQNGKWINNQGIRIDKIVADLRTKLGTSPSGRQILNELNI